MILGFFGESHTTDEIFQKSGAGVDKLITIAQMQSAIEKCGFKSERKIGINPGVIKSLIDQNIPVIALVHYGNLTSRQDQKFTGGHFVVIVGYREDGYFVNDPDFWGAYRADGDHHFYTKSDMESAIANTDLDGNQKNQILVILPKVQPTPEPIEKVVTDSKAKILIGPTPDGGDFGVMELQAIRSTLNDMSRDLKNLTKPPENTNPDGVSTPGETPETPGMPVDTPNPINTPENGASEVVEPVDVGKIVSGLLSQLGAWIKALLSRK
jgi:hypothetical protein